jgi:predicted DsbA family dithiol-disulfide isomerase
LKVVITVYFDFLCPYAWRGIELLNALGIAFEPIHYSLVQGNHPDNKGLPRAAPTWKLAEQPLNEGEINQRQSAEAFVASHAAAQQGSAAHARFILELLRLHHPSDTVMTAALTRAAATKAGLDIERFEADRNDTSARMAELARDTARAGEAGVFATPTVQLEDGNIAYFRFATLPESKAAQAELWAMYQSVLQNDARIETIKRAKPGTNA